jgi:TP901 family phage tail tape measure protein
MDLAKLGIAVDTTQMKRARDEYGRFIKASERVEDATDDVKRSSDNVNAAFKKTSGMASKIARGLGAIAAGYASIEGARRAISVARDFNSALAETSTLIEGTPEELDALTQGAIDLTKAYGGTATAQVQAYYQAISAGAGSVAEATKLLDQANKLAIGGVTDVTTGVDALTTAMNAYSAQGLTAAQASDALFVGMKAGKTTVGELGSALGQVVPIAAAAGVSFDEIVAGVAALTTQGQTTAMATTGLRQVIASVVAPTKQASDAAKQLGIAFDAQSLEAMGLAKFLDQIIDKTGGNTDAMAQLFGSVEALNAALAFSGGAGEKFSGIMADMANKAGATDEALNKVQKQLSQRLNKALGELGTIGLRIGNALLTVFVPAVEASVSAVSYLAENIDVMASAMIGLAATQIPNIVASLGTIVGAAGAAAGALRALGVAAWAATGPWGLLAGLVAGAASYFLVFKKNTNDSETASYDAAAATAALNGELAAFYGTAAPSAAASAIDVANSNYKLADSAVAAAKAELAKVQAMNETAEARLAEAGAAMPFGTEMGKRIEAEATRDLTKAERLLAEAELARNRAARAVTGTMSEQMTKEQQLRTEIEVTTKSLGTNIDKIEKKTDALVDAAKSIDESFGAAKSLGTNIDKIEKKTDALVDAAKSIDESFGAAFSSAIRGAESMGEAVGRVLDNLADQILSNAFTSLFSSIGLGKIFGPLVASANGNVFSGGNVMAFADGGVVSGPTVFPMRNGAGLMGEAGPEAIMPLERDRRGRLGVRSSGESGGTVEVSVRVDDNGNIVPVIERVSGNVVARAAPNIIGATDRRTGTNIDEYTMRKG